MLTRIMRHDWRLLAAERTLWAVSLLLALTIGYGVLNGASWVAFQERTLRAALAEEQERLTGIKTGIADADAGRTSPPSWLDPRSSYAVGYRLGTRYATMPPAPLAPLAIGQSDLLPYYFKVTMSSRQSFLSADEIENPVHLLAGRFDLAFVILYLYPLVILALGYNLIAAEKEDGTLAMTLSQPVSLGTLALGKIGTRFLFVLALAAGLSLAGALLAGADLAAPGALVRLGLWMLVVAAYGAFWFALAVLVNAFGGSSATNAVTLAGVWLGLVLLVPSLVNVAAKAVHPVPSRVDMIQSMRVASQEVTARRATVMARYLEDHPELAGADGKAQNEFGVRAVATQQELDRRMEPVQEHFNEQIERQQALVDGYRFLSPAIVAQSALYDLAGTSAFRYRHFVGQVTEYHQAWQRHFQPLTLRNARFTPGGVDGLPRFAFREEPLEAVVRRAATGLAGLLVPTLLIGLWAAQRLRRYPVVG